MDKSFPPSQQRIAKARREGNIAKSPYLPKIASFGACLLILSLFLRTSHLFLPITEGEDKNGVILLGAFAGTIAILTLVGIVGVIGDVLQGIAGWYPQKIAVKAEHLWGFKRLWEGILELPLLILRLGCFGVCLWWSKAALFEALFSEVTPLVRVADVLVWGAWRTVDATGICLIEYVWRRYRHFASLKMSWEEVKREFREEEGDPHCKAMRKAMHEELIRTEIVKRVRRAKVVVVERAGQEGAKNNDSARA